MSSCRLRLTELLLQAIAQKKPGYLTKRCYAMNRINKKNTSKLDQAAQRLAEIVMEQLSSLPIEKAKAMRQEIRRLAARRVRI